MTSNLSVYLAQRKKIKGDLIKVDKIEYKIFCTLLAPSRQVQDSLIC